MSATRPVAQGGAMFSSARAPVSKETQQLLKGTYIIIYVISDLR